MTPAAAVAPPADPFAGPAGADRTDEDRFLRATFRTHARTFGLAARLLPRPVRLPVATLYLYCRTVDEIADALPQRDGHDAARRALDAARLHLDRTLDGRPPDELLWRRLAETHARFGLPPGPLHELLDGALWDLDARPIRSTADLLHYSDLVAGSVGAMMLPFLQPDPAARAALDAPARALGRAMQVTNILRDVGEDRRRLGRVYLPADLLDEHGLAPGDLDGAALDGKRPAYAALCEHLMGLAETLYEDGARGIRALPGPSRTGIRAAAWMYRELLNEVRAARYDNLTRRAVVPAWRKVRAAAGGYAARRARLARP